MNSTLTTLKTLYRTWPQVFIIRRANTIQKWTNKSNEYLHPLKNKPKLQANRSNEQKKNFKMSTGKCSVKHKTRQPRNRGGLNLTDMNSRYGDQRVELILESKIFHVTLQKICSVNEGLSQYKEENKTTEGLNLIKYKRLSRPD